MQKATMCLYNNNKNNNRHDMSFVSKTLQEPHVVRDQDHEQMMMQVDDCSVLHSRVSSTTTASMAEIETLLDELVSAVHFQLQQEKFLDKRIAEEAGMALTRHVMGSQLGVIVCMNNIHAMRLERERVVAAIQLLEYYIYTLESQLEQYCDSNMIQDGDQLPVDIRVQRNYAQQVTQILSSPL
jgi:hypothetical protein